MLSDGLVANVNLFTFDDIRIAYSNTLMPIIQTWKPHACHEVEGRGLCSEPDCQTLITDVWAILGTRSFQSNQEGTSLIGSLDPRDTTYWVHACLQMAKRLKGKGLFQMCGFAGRKGDMGLQGEKCVSERHR